MSTLNAIELSWLVPNFNGFTLTPNSAEELSTLFVVFLIVVFTVFSIRFIWHFIITQKNLKWLLSKLKGIDKSNIAQKRERALSSRFGK